MFSDTSAEAQELNSGTKRVDEHLLIDEVALARWLSINLDGYRGPLEIRQFKGGQSNPTYELATPARTYVLRRKPPGKLLPTAHTVDREFTVISALAKARFPVARAYVLCRDESVIGSMFYIMEKVDGRILWDNTLPDYLPLARRAIYMAKLETLADLHNIDYTRIGLAGFGKPGNYFSRQIDRWTKQYMASATVDIPVMNRLIQWLSTTVPQDDRTSIVHGDYRLDNIILHPNEQRVVAVLDWELSTLGNPLADFTYLLLNCIVPWDQQGHSSDFEDRSREGIPTLCEYLAEYCRLTGRKDAPKLDWYFAYNLFRMAGISQGIVGRVRNGTALRADATRMESRVRKFAEAAWGFAQRVGAP